MPQNRTSAHQFMVGPQSCYIIRLMSVYRRAQGKSITASTRAIYGGGGRKIKAKLLPLAHYRMTPLNWTFSHWKFSEVLSNPNILLVIFEKTWKFNQEQDFVNKWWSESERTIWNHHELKLKIDNWYQNNINSHKDWSCRRDQILIKWNGNFDRT